MSDTVSYTTKGVHDVDFETSRAFNARFDHPPTKQPNDERENALKVHAAECGFFDLTASADESHDVA